MAPVFLWFRRTSITTRLGALLLIPIVGLSSLTVDRAIERHHVVVVSRSIREDAALTARLIDLSVDLDRELDVALGFARALDSGLSPALVSPFLNYDLGSSLVESQESLGESFGALRQQREIHHFDEPLPAIDGLIAMETEITQIMRRIPSGENSATEVERVHREARALLLQALEIEIGDLWKSQAGIGDAVNLTAAIRTNEAAIDVVSAARLEAISISAYLLPEIQSEAVDAEIELAVVQSNLRYTLEVLKRDIAPSLTDELTGLLSSEAWKDYERFRDEVNGGSIQAVELQDDDGNVNLAGGVAMARLVHSTFSARTEVLTDFQAAANQQMVIEAGQIQAGAEASRRTALLLVLFSTILTVIGAVATIRSILVPLSELKDRATRISEGLIEPDDYEWVGPRDLDAVDGAFDDLTSSLGAVVRQADLWAKGELDNAELNTTIAGPLGESIHASVEKLRQLTERLEYQANHDALTRLPNRAALLGHLEQNLTGSVDRRTPSTVMLLDLDGFKQANDSYGHLVGDEVLCRVADRLRARTTGHVIGRLGGDEFMVIIDKALDDEEVLLLGEAILVSISDPFVSSAGIVALSTCIGVVTTGTGMWLSPSEMLQRADVALYEGKAQGPSSMIVFDQSLHDSVLNQAALQSRLRIALDRDELELHYQPILGHNGAFDVEALTRWRPAGEAPIPPDIFIAAAEKSDLILDLDEWVLDRACAQLAEWSTSRTMFNVSISINISGRHVANDQLPGRVARALERHGIEPARLLIEVTETELIPSIEQAVGVLSQLRGIGVRLAIDDFGTGYASVAHLRRVQFDRIKIDGAFVSALDDPTERAIASLLVSLGVDLELEVVAEGVETSEQVKWAIQAGCTELQGYFFARPMCATEVEEAMPTIQANAAGWFQAVSVP